ncbi:MAG: AEC family transporter [Alphaproteobacteria bacterium]|jgi:hypothetical protein|nr:AEC family transporter [Alphaproteobacteria bacterium]MDP6567922.1 AEC family transporter [Alphaproteobacteria bacterium]MDP6813507.1 AEC family transporter [Alphaproteobacteria bacterium]
MFTTLTTIVPIFMLLALGWLLRLRRFPGDDFWRLLDPLVYYILFPALLVRTFAHVDIGEIDLLPAAAALCAMAVAAGLLLAARRHLAMDGPTFTSLVQSAVRFNSYVGLAVAAGLYGTPGLTMFSVVVAFATPAANLISVTTLNRYGSGGASSIRGLILAVAGNPMILSVPIGVGLGLSGIGLPWVLDPFFDILGRAALPLGLLAAGAGLEFAALRRGGRHVVLACLARLAVMPALAVAATWALDVTGLARMAVLIYAVLPVPPGSYILARQLGGDATLMASIISASTLVAALSVPLLLGLLA